MAPKVIRVILASRNPVVAAPKALSKLKRRGKNTIKAELINTDQKEKNPSKIDNKLSKEAVV